MNLCIIIITRNRKDDLDITLQSVYAQSILPDDVLIVDGGNTLNGEDLVKKYGCRYIHPGTDSSGITDSRNRGIEHIPANTDIVLFLDDDVTLDKDYLKYLKELFIKHPEISGASGFIKTDYYLRPWYKKTMLICVGLFIPSLVQATVFYPTVRRTYSTYPLFQFPGVDAVPAQWLSGCNMAYRIEVFREGYRFDTSLVGYCLREDQYFSNTLYKEGHKLLLGYKSQLTHRCSQVDRANTI
jgi:GT2 family glycosyltransferase